MDPVQDCQHLYKASCAPRRYENTAYGKTSSHRHFSHWTAFINNTVCMCEKKGRGGVSCIREGGGFIFYPSAPEMLALHVRNRQAPPPEGGGHPKYMGGGGSDKTGNNNNTYYVESAINYRLTFEELTHRITRVLQMLHIYLPILRKRVEKYI